MDSVNHAVAGAVVSTAAVAALAGRFNTPALAVLWGYGVLLSVFIDLDHFAIAYLKTGELSYLRGALSDPVRAFTDPAWVFPDVSMPFERLLSHALLGGGLALASLLVAPAVAVFTAVVVYVHVLADLVHEIRRDRSR